MFNQFLLTLIHQKEVYKRIREGVAKTPLEKYINSSI